MPMTVAVQACPVSGPQGGELVMVMCSLAAGNPPAGPAGGSIGVVRKATASYRRGGSAFVSGEGQGDGLDHAAGRERRADAAVEVVAGVVPGAGASDGQPCLVLGQARVVEIGVVVADHKTGGEGAAGTQRPDPGLMLPAVARVDRDAATGAARGYAAERMEGLSVAGIVVVVVDRKRAGSEK